MRHQMWVIDILNLNKLFNQGILGYLFIFDIDLSN